MEQRQTKTRSAVFTHALNYRGDVLIERGGLAVSIAMEDLIAIVAERMRFDAIASLQDMPALDVVRARMPAHAAGASFPMRSFGAR